MERDQRKVTDIRKMLSGNASSIDMCSDSLAVTDMYPQDFDFVKHSGKDIKNHSVGVFCFPNFSKYCQYAIRNIYSAMRPSVEGDQGEYIIRSRIPINENVNRGIFITDISVISPQKGDNKKTLLLRREVEVPVEKRYIDVVSAHLKVDILEKGMIGCGVITVCYRDYAEDGGSDGKMFFATSRPFDTHELFSYS